MQHISSNEVQWHGCPEGLFILLILSTLSVRHWRAYTEGKACTRCLPKAAAKAAKEPKKQTA